MKLQLKRINQDFHFQVADSDGRLINIDGAPAIGGEGKGTRPMELLLAAAAGCSSIDLKLILDKMKQHLTDYELEISGTRNEEVPKDFTSIHLLFKLTGDIHEDKAEKAINLTVNKYCSVIKSLNQDIDITYSFTINA